MRKRDWYLVLGSCLVLFSVILYTIHYAIFRDAHHVFIYLVGDIAFLPLEVLFVSLIVDQLMGQRDKRMTMEKMNMVIGAFFSEVGTELLRFFSSVDGHCADKREALSADEQWKNGSFMSVKDRFGSYEFAISGQHEDLERLKSLLIGKRDFMVRLLENPLLLEHESFTDLLWAVFHLTEELASRDDLSNLPDTDYRHIEGDMGRAYVLLGNEWLEYMAHLKKNYPYLFSLAIRLNPFDPCASVVVE